MGFLKKLNKTIKDTLDIDIEKETKQFIAEAINEVAGRSSGNLLDTAKGLIDGLKGSGTSNSRKTGAEHTPANKSSELNAGFTFKLRPDGTIRDLQEAFTEDYPYLRLGVYMVKTGQSADRSGGNISPYDSKTTFGEIRSFRGECVVEIEGRSTPQSLEKQFREISGLVIKICYNDEDDHRYYISKDASEYKKYICDLNREFREAGYKKADIS